MQRSVAACLASILEIAVADIPVPDAEHREPWTVWRNWLAQRGLGLVPIADPADFHWPGPWLALVCAADGDACIGAVAFRRSTRTGLESPIPTGGLRADVLTDGEIRTGSDIARR